MYFISEVDPNYRIKGSRDPLGFQSLWAAAGHKAIKHLSTVSVNLRDFMVLSYGFYFYEDRDSRNFLNFFYKFEQACAFARNIHNNEFGFNGIEFVLKNKEKDVFTFSTRPSDTLLSNQRSYGVYGKYIRPYRDMAINSDTNFRPVLEKSLQKTDPNKLKILLKSLLDDEITDVSRNDLICIADLLKELTPSEKEFYRDHILKLSEDARHPQNSLYDLLDNNKNVLKFESFKLHGLIGNLMGLEINEGLANALKSIQHTDRVLHPVNRIFSHLLSESSWTKKKIEKDKLISSIVGQNQDCKFSEPELEEMNNFLKSDGQTLVSKIVERNETVSKSRSNQPWILRGKGKESYKILYGENGKKSDVIDIKNNHEFTYFLDAYVSLYKQIELGL